ncbi:O-antigen ligase family protein [Blastococcus deserti]|uniref:O-antigen ligase family protein n=1 Tax=Blastococcus deserti TaxID=2259033 RepID=A0ABW4X8W0_9ACTN
MDSAIPRLEVPPARLRYAGPAVVGAGAALIVLGALATSAGRGPLLLGGLLVLAALAWTFRGGVRASQVFLVLVVVLLVVPARFRIEPLGVAGTPASLVGLSCMALWALGFVTGRPRIARSTPLRWALLAVVLTTMVSYVAAGFRPLDVVEARAADRGLLTIVSVIGVALIAAEVVRDRAALRRAVTAIVSAGAVVAAVGIVEFGLGLDLAAKLHLPGLTFTPVVFDSARAGFTRVVSTTSHPIELAVVLVMVLPLALWLFLRAVGHARIWWGGCLVLVAVAIPMTVSRTGVVGVIVALAVLLPTWTWCRRIRLLAAGGVGLVAFSGVVPGLIGTLRGFLLEPGGDTSIKSRQAGLERALDVIAERPLFGRGFGTFMPERYGYIDNQVLLGTVEIGIIGQVAYAALFLLAAGFALRARRVAAGVDRDDDRELAASLLAGVAVAASTWLTYDALSFPTGRALTFVLIGLLAALWRIVGRERRKGTAVTGAYPQGGALVDA